MLHLRVDPTPLAICRLPPADAIPGWAGGTFCSVTRTPDELSIVCDDARIPANVQCQRPFRALQVQGPLDFALTGILAALATPLAGAGIPIFALSTFDTDYLLVRESTLAHAISVLQAEGHVVL